MPNDMTFAEAAEWVIGEAANQVVIIGWLAEGGTQIVVYRSFKERNRDQSMGRLVYNVGVDRRLAHYCPDPLDEYQPLTFSLQAADRLQVVEQDLRDLFRSQLGPGSISVGSFSVRMLQRGPMWRNCGRDNHAVGAHLVRICEQLRMMYAGKHREAQKMIRLLLFSISSLLDDVRHGGELREMRPR